MTGRNGNRRSKNPTSSGRTVGSYVSQGTRSDLSAPHPTTKTRRNEMGRLILKVNLHDDTVDQLLDAISTDPDQAHELITSPQHSHAAAYIVQRVADARAER